MDAKSEDKPFSSAATLKAMGAPDWAVIAEAASIARHRGLKRNVVDLNGRVSNLERAVVAGATKSGASAGRLHGAFWGSLLAALISALPTCDAPRPDNPPPSDLPAEVGGANNQ